MIAAWICNTEGCHQFILTAGGQAGLIMRHVETKHNQKKAKANTISVANSSQSESTESSQSMAFRALVHTLNPDRIQKQVVRLCINEHIPLRKVDTKDWKDLMKLLNAGNIPMSRSSLRRWAIAEFDQAKAEVKAVLHQAKSKIHLSFDMWTSPNKYAVFAVVAHFVQSFVVQGKILYHNKAVLLSMKRMKDRHGAEEMSAVLVDVILDYEISERLGCFQSDNPAYNDNTVREVLKVFEPLESDPIARRVRCLGHIINLGARDFILGQDVEAFEDAVGGSSKSWKSKKLALERAQEAWRCKGPVGKLHNVVAYIRGSVQRTEAFRKIATGDELVDGKWLLFDCRNCGMRRRCHIRRG